MQKKFIVLVIAFAILGLLDSAYLTYIHYSSNGSTICNQIGNFECDIVTQSTFSELTGILAFFGITFYFPFPVSILGFLFFVTMLVISASLYRKKALFGLSVGKNELKHYLFLLSLGGMGFGLFLIYIQAFVLRAWCLFCLILDLILFSLLALSFHIRKSRSH